MHFVHGAIVFRGIARTSDGRSSAFPSSSSPHKFSPIVVYHHHRYGGPHVVGVGVRADRLGSSRTGTSSHRAGVAKVHRRSCLVLPRVLGPPVRGTGWRHRTCPSRRPRGGVYMMCACACALNALMCCTLYVLPVRVGVGGGGNNTLFYNDVMCVRIILRAGVVK